VGAGPTPAAYLVVWQRDAIAQSDHDDELMPKQVLHDGREKIPPNTTTHKRKVWTKFTSEPLVSTVCRRQVRRWSLDPQGVRILGARGPVCG
jgi:hypothetical protein